jgi:hypothetical protein
MRIENGYKVLQVQQCGTGELLAIQGQVQTCGGLGSAK